jgi:hypothetical protein
MKIDRSDDLKHACDSIRVNCEFDPNVIDENDLQHEKHLNPRISTAIRIKVDRSDEYRNPDDSIGGESGEDTASAGRYGNEGKMRESAETRSRDTENGVVIETITEQTS